MAVYKVIQDIEAEDKLLGPLGLKQFIYAIIAIVCAFICFRSAIATEFGPARFLVVFIFIMPTILFGVLAAPLGGIQSTENWLLARLRFMLKPQKRIWDQSGMKELVTITAPKKIMRQYTDGLSQGEVKSRLNALATTLDSRGWAVKNVSVNLFAQPGYFTDEQASDRLITTDNLPQVAPTIDVRPEDDILDPKSNATAHHLDRLMEEASTKVKLGALEKFNQTRGSTRPDAQPVPAPDFWFMHQAEPGKLAAKNEMMFSAPVVAHPGEDTEKTLTAATSTINISPQQEQDLLKNIEKGKSRSRLLKSNMPNLTSEQPKPAPKKLTPEQQTAIITLAERDDISVETVAKEAKRQTAPKPMTEVKSDGEIVINLH